MENRRDRIVLSDCRIDHKIVKGSVGPVRPEVVFDKGAPFAIDSLDKSSIRLAFAVRDQASNSLLTWRIKENMKSVTPVLEKTRSAAPYNNGVTRASNFVSHSLHGGNHLSRTHGPAIVKLSTTFVTSAPKNLGQATKPIVSCPGMTLSRRYITVQ